VYKVYKEKIVCSLYELYNFMNFQLNYLITLYTIGDEQGSQTQGHAEWRRLYADWRGKNLLKL